MEKRERVEVGLMNFGIFLSISSACVSFNLHLVCFCIFISD